MEKTSDALLALIETATLVHCGLEELVAQAQQEKYAHLTLPQIAAIRHLPMVGDMKRLATQLAIFRLNAGHAAVPAECPEAADNCDIGEELTLMRACLTSVAQRAAICLQTQAKLGATDEAATHQQGLIAALVAAMLCWERMKTKPVH